MAPNDDKLSWTYVSDGGYVTASSLSFSNPSDNTGYAAQYTIPNEKDAEFNKLRAKSLTSLSKIEQKRLLKKERLAKRMQELRLQQQRAIAEDVQDVDFS